MNRKKLLQQRIDELDSQSKLSTSKTEDIGEKLKIVKEATDEMEKLTEDVRKFDVAVKTQLKRYEEHSTHLIEITNDYNVKIKRSNILLKKWIARVSWTMLIVTLGAGFFKYFEVIEDVVAN